MKTTEGLHDALHKVHLPEGTMHTEELSKQYLDTVKKDTQIDSIHHNKPKHDKSQGKSHPFHSSSFDAISGADADIPEKISKEWIVSNPKYKHLFQGIGRFKCDPVWIKIARNAIPVQKPPQRVPLALKDQFKQELDNMVSQGILSKLNDANVNVPEWLNFFVVVNKLNGKLHICLDPTDLNPYIVRPVCNARTLDEVTALLKDAVHFAVFDSTKGFFHVPLDEASKLLTAMLCWQWDCQMPLTSLSPVFVKFLMGSMELSTLQMMYWSMVVTIVHLNKMLLGS